MFNYNDNVPSQNTLEHWAILTSSNHHKNVRNEIGTWAAKNCRDKRLKTLIRSCTKSIVGIYDGGEKSNGCDNDEFDFMCRLSRLLIDMIKCEYGEETANLIAATL